MSDNRNCIGEIKPFRKARGKGGGRPMSVYAEYLHAETEEEREDALRGMKWEARRDEYLDKLYEEQKDEE